MFQALDLGRDLRRWWEQQSDFSTRKELAKRTGISYSSLKKYFAGRKRPSGKNRVALFEVTGLQILRPMELPLGKVSFRSDKVKPQVPVRQAISKKISRELNRRLRYTSSHLGKLGESLTKTLLAVASLEGFLQNVQDNADVRIWTQQVNVAQGLLDALERVLRPFLESPEGIRILRSKLSGPDAGYLSGLLAALFDDTRLSNWKTMTTYAYGGSRRGHRV